MSEVESQNISVCSVTIIPNIPLFEGQPALQRLKGVDGFVRHHLPPEDILAVLEALAGEAQQLRIRSPHMIRPGSPES